MCAWLFLHTRRVRRKEGRLRPAIFELFFLGFILALTIFSEKETRARFFLGNRVIERVRLFEAALISRFRKYFPRNEENKMEAECTHVFVSLENQVLFGRNRRAHGRMLPRRN